MLDVRTFPCPNCNEIINDSMRECRYCSAPVDPQAAHAAAELQGKVNQACSDASYTKTAALLMLAFMGLSIIPFVPLVTWAFLITFFAVVIMLIRWQIKFGGLRTRDQDYMTAKRSRNIALVLWLVAVPVWVVGSIIVSVILAVLLN